LPQKVRMVILDESFAALDPETLSRPLQCELRRASTLMVIAHRQWPSATRWTRLDECGR
jgi:ABC-type multidrug transport system fused ATPase/permease subunit